MMTTENLDRRKFGAMIVGGAAAAVAGPALAQRRRMPMGMNMGMTPVSALTAGDWMQQVRAQHREIDRHFAMLKNTRDRDAGMRDMHLKQLATVLTGHSIAEEVALYPGVAITGDRPGSDKLYMDQQHAKVMVAEIDAMPRMGPMFMERLTALEAAIKAHVAEEETQKYPQLMRTATREMNLKMTADFRREFTRYMV